MNHTSKVAEPEDVSVEGFSAASNYVFRLLLVRTSDRTLLLGEFLERALLLSQPQSPECSHTLDNIVLGTLEQRELLVPLLLRAVYLFG